MMTFPEILDTYCVPYKEHGTHHHTSSGWLNTDCIRCSPASNRYRLGFHLNKRYFSCWLCGRLPFVPTICELTGERWDTLRNLLGSLRTRSEDVRQPSGRLELPKSLGPLLPVHKRYLLYRGFDPDEIVNTWQVQGIGLTARLAWRLFIPITINNKTVSWTTRSLIDTGTRYVSAKPNQESVPHKHLLYGEDRARHAIIICEGPLDVWRIGPGAVATLGVVWTRPQLLRMVRYPVRAVCFDSEPQAQERARRLADALESFPGQTSLVQLDAKDPGSASEREVRLLRKEFLR